MSNAKRALLVIIIVVTAAIALFFQTVNSEKSADYVSGDIQEATKKDFFNSIILMKDHVVVTIDGNANDISFEDLQDGLGRYAEKLRDREVNIIGARDANYKKFVDVLDLMTIYQIPKYKLMRSELKSKDI